MDGLGRGLGLGSESPLLLVKEPPVVDVLELYSESCTPQSPSSSFTVFTNPKLSLEDPSQPSGNMWPWSSFEASLIVGRNLDSNFKHLTAKFAMPKMDSLPSAV
ncbi:hypothetical protein Mapa_005955 [Marchantia paleacea]|nr:hypothetical protein Mapa_005955 [Marchantia paleacea]